MDICIDFSKVTGTIKALHGINNSPIDFGRPLNELHDAGIPYVRLHDTAGAFGGTHYVDIPNVFPDFNADSENPESYDFAFTDAYLKKLVECGAKPFYRLGVTIEGSYKIKAYEIHPPADFLKWAKICAGIVRHYTEGWANGFYYDMEYWEIWNEPENPPMWSGTPEQYFELYRVTANYLKKSFPNIKIGGYGGCGFYSITRSGMGDFFDGFLSYFDHFLRFVTAPETHAPLDFFSWHLYTTDPHEIINHALYVDSKLKEYGLGKTESFFNEWNFIDWKAVDFDRLKEAPGAAFVASAFCLMQTSPIDKAMYYDALPTRSYCGLYYFPSLKLTKTYHAFHAFNELYRLKNEVKSSCDTSSGISVCAAADSKYAAALIVNNNAEERNVKLAIEGKKGPFSLYLLDQEHTLEEKNSILNDGNILHLPPFSVVCMKYLSDDFNEKKLKQSDDSAPKHTFAGIDVKEDTKQKND